jgi:uncharacterized protein YndB with AHSA1/START domain
MKTDGNARQSVESFEIGKEIAISAPIDITFAAVLDELGPEGQMPGGKPFPMKIEAWPGGRWYRDLGNNSGHLWGHVQVIKPPTLLEICGPLMMSYPAAEWLAARLGAAQGGEGADAAQRRAGAAAAGAAVGSDRQGVSIRDRRRERLAGRPLPRALAAPRLPLHVRARLHGGVSVLLVDRGRVQRLRRPPGEPRRHAFGGVAGAACEAAGVQAADGLDVSLGVLARRDFNFDFNVSFTEEQQREGTVEYNYRRGGHAMDATPVPEPVAQFAAMMRNRRGPRTRAIGRA